MVPATVLLEPLPEPRVRAEEAEAGLPNIAGAEVEGASVLVIAVARRRDEAVHVLGHRLDGARTEVAVVHDSLVLRLSVVKGEAAALGLSVRVVALPDRELLRRWPVRAHDPDPAVGALERERGLRLGEEHARGGGGVLARPQSVDPVERRPGQIHYEVPLGRLSLPYVDRLHERELFV